MRTTGVPQVDAGGGVDVEVGPPLHHHHHLVARPSRPHHLHTGGSVILQRGAVGTPIKKKRKFPLIWRFRVEQLQSHM